MRAIEETVERSAIAGLEVAAGHRRLSREVTAEEYARTCQELREKERALAELSVEYTLPKKSERSGSPTGEDGAGVRPRRGRRSAWR